MKKESIQKQQIEIGEFIKTLRKEKGLTQTQLAEILETTQSAIARMERGGLNFSTQELIKIGDALDHQLIKIKREERDDFIINGGKKLSGKIATNTSKNGAMGMMSASLLNKGTTTLHGIPRIQEVFRFIEIFESMGVDIQWIKNNTITITPPKRFNFENLNKKSARRVRSFLMCIGALSHHMKSFKIPTAGGCKMGERTIAAHKHGLEALGMKITTQNTGYLVERTKLKAAEIVMNILKNSDKVLQDPAPSVYVTELGENGVKMVALPFCTVADYWDVFWGLRGEIKKALGAAGFEAALPQRVVTMKKS